MKNRCPVCDQEAKAIKHIEMGDRFRDVMGNTVFGIFDEYQRVCKTKENHRGNVSQKGLYLYFHKPIKGTAPASN